MGAPHTEDVWTRVRSKRRALPLYLVLCILIGFVLLEFSAHATEFEDGVDIYEDAIVIKVGQSTSDEFPQEGDQSTRNKRQLFGGFGAGVFPPGWPFIQGSPISVHQHFPQQYPQVPLKFPSKFPHHQIHLPQQQVQFPNLQHQFPHFPQFGQFPSIIHNHLKPLKPLRPPTSVIPPSALPIGSGPCLTSNGLNGYCASLRQCYPILYSPEDGTIMNNRLADMYRNMSGACNKPEMGHFLMFKADAEVRRKQICCGTDVVGQPAFPYPQFTVRPPWILPVRLSTTTATTTSTTAETTTRPQTTRTYPQHTWSTTQATTTTARTQTPGTTTSPPVSSSCGVSKIVGGNQAEKGEFPWLVALIRNGRQVCGGSLIDSQYVLTAAHCFNGVTARELQALFKVHIGDYDLHTLQDGPVTVKSISKLILHRQFHQQYFYNDIALLKLDSPVTFGSNGNNDIRPICLSSGGNYDGEQAWVAGWGRTSAQNAYQPGAYRKVELNVWNLQQCAAKYGSLAPGGITSQMMCAGQANKDSCLGDSGGPLMRKVGSVWEQIGLVSWGIGCGAYPGVYTRIADYQNWISRHRHH